MRLNGIIAVMLLSVPLPALAQVYTGGTVFFAEFGLTGDFVQSADGATCQPCAQAVPVLQMSMVAAGGDLSVLVAGPIIGDPYSEDAFSGRTHTTTLAVEGRRRLGSLSLGARLMHASDGSASTGTYSSAQIIAAAGGGSGPVIEVGGGPLMVGVSGETEQGWGALAGIRFTSSAWAFAGEVQATMGTATEGWGGQGRLTYRLAPLSVFATVHGQQFALPQEPARSPSPLPWPTGGVSASAQYSFIQSTLGAEVPITRGLRLIGEAGARSASGWPAEPVIRAGIRFSAGPWSPARRPAARWDVHRNRAELALPADINGQLYLTGDFNGWAEPGIPLRREGQNLTVAIQLPPGHYSYRIAAHTADGREWLELPATLATEDDGFGGRNGLLIIP